MSATSADPSPDAPSGETPTPPMQCGPLPMQMLLDRHINAFAVELLIESIARSRLLEAVPEGISFSLGTGQARHAGVQITITRSPATAAAPGAADLNQVHGDTA